MDRRRALGIFGGGVLAASFTHARAGEDRGYVVVTEVDLSMKDAPVSLYVPLFESLGDWQRAGAATIEGVGFAPAGRPVVVRDARYKAPMARAVFEGAGPRALRVRQEVFTRDRALNPARLTPAEVSFWTAPLPSLPKDGVVRETALRITASATTPRAKARAIYDWIVDNTFRDAAVRGCGIGGVEAMLRTGYLGGKCADINGLMVALCRAAGLPARDVYGVRLAPSRLTPVLGLKTQDATRAQHCRAEVHLAGEGWLPVDPADVRKIVLDAKAPVDSDLVRSERERLFGTWEMNWAGYNHATDIRPPGAPRAPGEHFLMYPMALSASGEADQLDPDAFRYAIRSTPV